MKFEIRYDVIKVFHMLARCLATCDVIMTLSH